MYITDNCELICIHYAFYLTTVVHSSPATVRMYVLAYVSARLVQSGSNAKQQNCSSRLTSHSSSEISTFPGTSNNQEVVFVESQQKRPINYITYLHNLHSLSTIPALQGHLHVRQPSLTRPCTFCRPQCLDFPKRRVPTG